MNRSTVLMMFVLTGCGTKLVDPCLHQTGACLALHIDSSPTVARLSSAQLHVTGGMIDVTQSVALQGGAASTELPVAVALTFPNLDAALDVQLDVLGSLDGTAIGEAMLSAAITPGQHTSAHVQLSRVLDNGDDGGGADDMATSDLTGYVPLTVQLGGTGSGTITGSGIVCSGATCTGQYLPHTMVSLAASPAANANFSGWSGGGCTGTSTCVVIVDAATTINATFDWKFVPSHVSATDYKTNAANLSGVTAIDTHNLTINGAAPAAGLTFAFDNGIAVLSVSQWTIDQAIAVTGDAPLAVIASGAVVVTTNGSIDASAKFAQAGPGGNAPCALKGIGTGGPTAASGGGGDFGGGASMGGGGPGQTFGAALTDFCGGAKGGDGAVSYATVGSCMGGVFVDPGIGGGGGGAIQISSAVSITIQSGAQISAAGGGGGGGCYYHTSLVPYDHTMEAAGGGSGGDIFLEAPMIQVAGGLFANGGGGGGPRNGTNNGSTGNDGPAAATAASGGAGFGGQNGAAGAYSADGQTITAATAANPPTTGGGGGGVGRIWLRTRAGSSTNGATISPPPMTDTTL